MISDNDLAYEQELQKQSLAQDKEVQSLKAILENSQTRARLLNDRVYVLRNALIELIDATIDGSSLWISGARGAAIDALRQIDPPTPS